jgi:hypothetical protein
MLMLVLGRQVQAQVALHPESRSADMPSNRYIQLRRRTLAAMVAYIP